MHIRKSKSNRSKFRILSSDKLPGCISYTTSWPYYAHDYLLYDSAHPDDSRDNVPCDPAKRIIFFVVSNEEKIEYRLNELKNWLKSCKYPENVINRAFCDARLQGSAPLKTNSNNIPFVTTYYDNVNYNEKVLKNP